MIGILAAVGGFGLKFLGRTIGTHLFSGELSKAKRGGGTNSDRGPGVPGDRGPCPGPWHFTQGLSRRNIRRCKKPVLAIIHIVGGSQNG